MSSKTAAVNQNVFALLFAQIKDFGANFEKSVPAEDKGKSRVKLTAPKLKFNFPIAKYLSKIKSAIVYLKRRPKMAIGVGLGLFVLIIAIVFLPGIWPNSAVRRVAGSQSDFSPQKQTAINGGGFDVPIRNSEGNEIGAPLRVNTTHIERAEEVLYQGKPLVSKKGKDFLVINLEVENSTNNRLTVRPVDFYRIIDSSGKSYAADIQTEAIKVEPQSSKKTRVIYIIADDQRNIKLEIGEVRGENKETIEIAI